MATKNVNIDIIAKDKTAKAMQSATKGINNLKNNVQQSVAVQNKSFMSLGNTVKTVIGGVVAFQAFRFSQQMVMMASAVEEMQAKSSVVFGRFVSSVRKELEIFGDNVGRSTQELEGMASSIQDTFVPMGFAREEASKLAVQLTKLAVDVASFNNASDVDTMMAFQSALVGNHETVRRFGVVITEATLKQELLRMGITKTADEVTNAEKVQARLNLILAGTTDAQGDAERTSDSFANSMKALNAEFQEFMVEAVTPMLPALSKMIQSLKDSILQTKEFLRSIGLLSKLNEVVPIVDKLKNNTDALADAQAKLTFEREKLNFVERASINPLILLTKETDKFGIKALSGKRVVEENIEALKNQIKEIKATREIILLESDARQKVINSVNDEIKAKKKLADAEKEAKEAMLPKLRPDIIGFQMPTGPELGLANQIDASMSGSELLDAEANKITQLQQMADIEVDIAQQTADKTLEIARETARKETQIKEQFLNENLALMRQGKFNQLKIEEMTAEQRQDLVVASGRDILAQLAQHNKTAFKLNKALAISDAVVNTARGITRALALGPVGIPLAVVIGAMGALQVGMIASQKYQGRRLGGRMNQGQPYMVGEAGPEMVVPDRASNVVPNNKLGGSQPVTVNFNINTVDARGFNELLVNSRGTIVNMINSAMNEKGRMAIV